jgi:NADH:ubiquinone oxidoreductase subunit 3 (subunit A)
MVLYGLSYILSSKLGSAQKLSIYECGFEPISNIQTKFNIKFYLVAILFVIFDLELIFLFPWAVSLTYLGLFGYYTMVFFCVLLIIGFIFEYRKGALDW